MAPNILDQRGIQSDDLAPSAGNIQRALGLVPSQGVAGLSAGTTYRNSTVAASAAINTAETLLLATPLAAGVSLRVGSIVRWIVHGTNTSTVANASTLNLRAGILGTIADASFATAAVTSAAAGAGIAFELGIQFVVQTLGAAGTAFGSMRVTNTGATGIAAVTNTVVPFTSATLATTTATFLDLTYVSAATTTTSTFQDISCEIIV